jgi:hypothetical protein
MAKNETNTAVATVETKNTLPAGWEDMAADAGVGLENTSAEDYAIPFISILQALSPQLNKQEGKYIKGAEQGQIFNNVTNEVVDGEEKGIQVVPVGFKFTIVEWKPRESGGGIVAIYDRDNAPDDAEKDAKGRDVRPNGNSLVSTGTHYVLLVKEDGSFEQAVISMSSTQLKKSRRWALIWSYVFLAIFAGFFLLPPIYMFITSLKTSAEISAATNPWWVFNPTLDNYKALLTSKEFLIFFRNSTVVSVCVVIITMIVSILAAFSLARMKF